MTTQELLLGLTSQVLVLVPPRPLASVAAVALYKLNADDTSTAETAVSGAGTVDATTTTTNAAAGSSEADPKFMSLTSSVGFVNGRRYYIHKDGLGEAFDLARRYATGHDLYARRPLVNDYATGATLISLRATIAVTDAWSADLTNLSANENPNARYRARWSVTYTTIDGSTGATDVLYTNVDLARYSSASQVSPLDVEDSCAGWIDSLGPDDRSTQGAYLIAEAADLVRSDLHGRGIPVRSIRNADTHRRLVVARTVYLSTESNAIRGAASLDQMGAAKLAYDRQIAALVESPRLAQDKLGGGGATTTSGRSAPLWVR